MTTATTELTIPEITADSAPQVFKTGGLAPFVEQVAQQVKGEVPDLTTDKGRKRIASLAMQVARSKTAIEKPGREYLREIKALPKTVETELREFVRAMDALRDEVRGPLNEWEAVEKARIEDHEAKLERIRNWLDPEKSYTSSELEAEIQRLVDLSIDDMEEYADRAALSKEATHSRLTNMLAPLKESEAQQAELEKLRQEAAQREQQEREQRIAIEAAAKAKAEAELAVKVEREEAIQREAALKAQAEQAQRDAQQAAQLAEQQADQQKQQAIEAERQRYEAERLAKQQADDLAKREAEAKAANVEHRKTINNAALLSLMMSADLSEGQAKDVITAIAKGEVQHVTINY